MFNYSRRKGTKAYNYEPIVPLGEKKKRVKKTIELGKKLSFNYRLRFINKTVRMLVEKKRDNISQLLTGYTDEYIQLRMDGPDSLYGKLINVRVIKADPKTDFCIAIRKP